MRFPNAIDRRGGRAALLFVATGLTALLASVPPSSHSQSAHAAALLQVEMNATTGDPEFGIVELRGLTPETLDKLAKKSADEESWKRWFLCLRRSSRGRVGRGHPGDSWRVRRRAGPRSVPATVSAQAGTHVRDPSRRRGAFERGRRRGRHLLRRVRAATRPWRRHRPPRPRCCASRPRESPCPKTCCACTSASPVRCAAAMRSSASISPTRTASASSRPSSTRTSSCGIRREPV